MIFPHRFTVYASGEEIGADGNAVRRPGSTGVTVDGFLQPRHGGATENLAAPQTAEARYHVFLAADCPPLDAFARIDHGGDTFDLIGEAQHYTSPDGTVDFWRATVRRT